MGKFEYFVHPSKHEPSILVRLNKFTGKVEKYIQSFGWQKDMSMSSVALGTENSKQIEISEREAHDLVGRAETDS